MRRTYGPERHPNKAALIRRRFPAIVAWASSVNHEGIPLDGSLWVRKLSGHVWRVSYLERGHFVRLRKIFGREEELVTLQAFFEHFIPEALAERYACPACDGDVTMPHSSDCNYARGN